MYKRHACLLPLGTALACCVSKSMYVLYIASILYIYIHISRQPTVQGWYNCFVCSELMCATLLHVPCVVSLSLLLSCPHLPLVTYLQWRQRQTSTNVPTLCPSQEGQDSRSAQKSSWR